MLERRPLSANVIPRDCQSPQLPTYESKDIVQVMAGVEWSKIPVGLYEWQGYLYMLTREPQGQGTSWRIFKIDPRREEIIGSTLLQTQANHLTVIPGPETVGIC